MDMPKFEYKIVELPYNCTDILLEYGRYRWELIAINESAPAHQYHYFFYFKRQLIQL